MTSRADNLRNGGSGGTRGNGVAFSSGSLSAGGGGGGGYSWASVAGTSSCGNTWSLGDTFTADDFNCMESRIRSLEGMVAALISGKFTDEDLAVSASFCRFLERVVGLDGSKVDKAMDAFWAARKEGDK